MRRTVLFLVCAALMSSCEYLVNNHIRFTNGVVITESRNFSGVYLKVDTTYDGIADIEASVVGQEMFKHYAFGDTILVDIRQSEHFAEPIEKEKSK